VLGRALRRSYLDQQWRTKYVIGGADTAQDILTIFLIKNATLPIPFAILGKKAICPIYI
jgi:hypothetical protein